MRQEEKKTLKEPKMARYHVPHFNATHKRTRTSGLRRDRSVVPRVFERQDENAATRKTSTRMEGSS